MVAASLTFIFAFPRQTPDSAPLINYGSRAVAARQTDSTRMGVPVSEEALRRDMMLTESNRADSLRQDSIVLPKHYVQPVGLKRDSKKDIVF